MSDQLSLPGTSPEEIRERKRRTRADQIFDAFAKFHKANPRIWELFQQYTQQLIKRGFKNHSAKAIFERIRWDVNTETVTSDLKLNNSHCPYYARMFHAKHPEHDGFFRNRKRISEKKSAAKNDLQVFDSGKPGDESQLIERLSSL